MHSSIVSNPSFSIKFSHRGKPFTMTAKLALETASYERWELHGKTQLFYFENNRPALVHGNDKKNKVHWFLIKGLEYITNPDDGAIFLKDAWEAIENKSVGKKDPTFQEVRNKQ